MDSLAEVQGPALGVGYWAADSLVVAQDQQGRLEVDWYALQAHHAGKY